MGADPVIPDPVTNKDNLDSQYDFRQVYASVLHQWFGVDKAELDAVLLQDFGLLPLAGDPGSPRAPIVNQGGPAAAGLHTVSFDAAGLPGGVYYVRMVSGGYSRVITVNLIK